MKENPYELPESWTSASLGDLGVWSGGGTPSKANKSYWSNGTVPWVSPKDMKSGRIRNAEDWITEEAVSQSAAKYIPANSVLMVTRSGILAHTFPVAVNECRVTVNQDLKTLTPFDCAEPNFLAWYLRAENIRILNECAKHGTTVASIDTERLKKLTVPVAPFNEQRRIVEKIEILFAQLDKGEEGLHAVQKLLARYRQSVLKAAVTGQLTADWRAENGNRIWTETTLGAVNAFLTSGSRGWAKFYSDEGDLFIRAQNIKHDRLELDDVAYVSLPAQSEGIRTRVERGDLLVTITGANVTKSALVERDLGTAYVSQHVALFRPTDAIEPEFLYWFVIAKAGGRKQLEKYAYGAGRPGLNLQNIKDVTIALPPFDEQSEIVQRIRESLSRQEAIRSEIKNQLQCSAALRQSILKDAFAGRLVPQDPADEPAADLLARIKETRAAAPRKSRRKATETLKSHDDLERAKPLIVQSYESS